MHEFVFSSFSCAGIFFCGNKSNPPAKNGPSLIANGYMELVIIFTICITCGLKLQWYCKENWNAIILNRWSFTKRDQCFLFFFFLLQLITPKFPVVVKVGHANGGYGKVRISILMNFASLQLIFLKLINQEEMRGSWSLDKHHEVSCQKYATARSIFNYLLGIWKSNQTRAFADNRRPLSF